MVIFTDCQSLERTLVDGSLGAVIVNREEGLAAGGVARLCYCSMSRDKTSALLKRFVIGEMQRIRFYLC